MFLQHLFQAKAGSLLSSFQAKSQMSTLLCRIDLLLLFLIDWFCLNYFP